MRDKGLYPCPRCLVAKSKLDNLGLVRDVAIREKGFRQYLAHKVEAAQKMIYDLARPITGAAVDRLLKEFSGVPTKASDKFLICFWCPDTWVVECLR
jgi:hypothetical protein